MSATAGPSDNRVVLEGVGPYAVMEPMFEGTRVILSYRGAPYSPAYVQGITGAAFWVAGICPCAPTCTPGAIDPTELPGVLGWESEYLSFREEGTKPEELLAGYLDKAKAELRAGHPVLVWHAFTNAEWDVVAGFDDETGDFLGRGSYAGCDDYARQPQGRTITCGDICPPWGMVLIREPKATEPDLRELELRALREAARHAHTPAPEPKPDGSWAFHSGLACYDRWVREWAEDPARKRGSGDSYCLAIYRSTHRAGAGFLREIAPKYPPAAAILQQAGHHMEAEADALDRCEPLLGWSAPGDPDAEDRQRIAECLAAGRGAYARAIGLISDAAEVIEVG